MSEGRADERNPNVERMSGAKIEGGAEELIRR